MSMPMVKTWADDLRAAFGAAEFDAGLRECGSFACEGGRTLDTRKPLGTTEIPASALVILRPTTQKQGPARG